VKLDTKASEVIHTTELARPCPATHTVLMICSISFASPESKPTNCNILIATGGALLCGCGRGGGEEVCLSSKHGVAVGVYTKI